MAATLPDFRLLPASQQAGILKMPEPSRSLVLARYSDVPAHAAALEPRSESHQAACQAICRTNACGAFDPVNDACRRCGCASQRREAWEAKLRVGECPKGLWPKAE